MVPELAARPAAAPVSVDLPVEVAVPELWAPLEAEAEVVVAEAAVVEAATEVVFVFWREAWRQ